VILRCFHQSVPRCRSKPQEQREPAKCKCWQREQRSGAGLLVKCLPTAWSLPVPPQRFRHVPLQGQLSTLYNLSRPCEGVSLSSMDLRCLQRVVGNVIGDRVPLEEPPLRIARESGRDGWPVAATAWLGGRGCTAHFAHAQCRCVPRQTAGTSVRASFPIACP
jgi:hypothetical protein